MSDRIAFTTRFGPCGGRRRRCADERAGGAHQLAKNQGHKLGEYHLKMPQITGGAPGEDFSRSRT